MKFRMVFGAITPRWDTFTCWEIKRGPCRRRANVDRITQLYRATLGNRRVPRPLKARHRDASSPWRTPLIPAHRLTTSRRRTKTRSNSPIRSRIIRNIRNLNFNQRVNPVFLSAAPKTFSVDRCAPRSPPMSLSVTDIETALSITHNRFPEQTGSNVRSKCGLHSHKYSRGAS